MAEVKTPYGTVVGLILTPAKEEVLEKKTPEKPKRPKKTIKDEG